MQYTFKKYNLSEHSVRTFFYFFFDVELCSLNIVQAIERYFKSKFLFYSGQNRLRLKK